MIQKVITWILVADHQHARIYVNDGPGHGISLLDSHGLETHLAAGRDINSDGPGKGFSGRTARRFSVEPRTDAHRQAGERFLAEVIHMVNEASDRDDLDRLIVVAPPRALGEIRKMLPAHLHAKIIGELAQDLTKVPAATLLDHLSGVLAA